MSNTSTPKSQPVVTTPTPTPVATTPTAVVTTPQPGAGATPKPPSASLYVGDLSVDVTEAMLFEIFNAVGPVHSIRVCRDSLTRRSLGYAYVNFHSVVDAERALHSLNTSVIMHRPCRIMWSQRDPSVRKSGAGNIFIKNLDTAIGHKELYDHFSEYGSILSCKVALNETGGSKGYGFVHFENKAAADLAIEKMNNKKVGTKEVYVGFFIPRKMRVQHIEQSWTNVYVKDVDPEISLDEFKLLFEKFGPVNSPLIKRDHEKTGFPTDFGFVNFVNHEDAKAAVEALNGRKLGNKNITCCRAMKRFERETRLKSDWEQQKFNKYNGINLYVKHIEDEVDEETLRREFSAFGEVKSCKIPVDEKGSSKGFGFVCFSTPEEAQKAIIGLNSKILHKKPLFVALHESKEVRKQKLAHRHNLAMTKNIRGVQQQMYSPQGQGMFYPNGAGGFPYPQQVLPMQQQQRGWPGPQQFQPMSPTNYMAGMMGARSGGARGGANGGANVGNTGGAGGNTGGVGGAGAGRQQQQRPGNNNRQQGTGNRRSQQHMGGPIDGGLHDFTLAQLLQFPHEQQKLLLGERLYPLIVPTHGALAGKITGMFLDSGWTTEELLSLIHDEHKLQQKISNAIEVLHRAQTTDQEENNV
jgi:polyadenylate-binding protein